MGTGGNYGNLAGRNTLVFAFEARVYPQEVLLFVPHPDQAAEARVFVFDQGLEATQGSALGADRFAMFQREGVVAFQPASDLITAFQRGVGLDHQPGVSSNRRGSAYVSTEEIVITM